MLASFPASMVNQKPADLGIQNQFNLTRSRFSTEKREPDEGHDNDRDAQTNDKQQQHRRTRFSLSSFRRRLDDYAVFFDNHHPPPFTHSTVASAFRRKIGPV